VEKEDISGIENFAHHAIELAVCCHDLCLDADAIWAILTDQPASYSDLDEL
jgi:hypothetical protein